MRISNLIRKVENKAIAAGRAFKQLGREIAAEADVRFTDYRIRMIEREMRLNELRAVLQRMNEMGE